MSTFMLLSFTLLMLVISSSMVRYLLEGKVEKKIINLIYSISILPGVPIFWLMFNRTEFQSNDTLTILYIPLFFTIMILIILFVNIVKFIKN